MNLEIHVKSHIENNTVYFTAMYNDSIHSGKYLKSVIKRCLKDNKVNHSSFSIEGSILKNSKLNYLVTIKK